MYVVCVYELLISDLSHNAFFIFFFNDTATTEIYTLSLHDALPIYFRPSGSSDPKLAPLQPRQPRRGSRPETGTTFNSPRSEEHTSELQSRQYLVCRLLLEKKKNQKQLLSNI